MISACDAAPELNEDQLTWLGDAIFQNECNRRLECLTAWNEGEEFPSLGLGHFIWYPPGQIEIFEESFPALLGYLKAHDLDLPRWLEDDGAAPWTNRKQFLAQFDEPKMNELRALLAETLELQTRFIIERFRQAMARMLADAPAPQRQKLEANYHRLAAASAPYGLYALIDYSHFKGTGLSETERYQGQGWGLLQVLTSMPGQGEAPLADFIETATNILAERVKNSPPERNEQRWLPGWTKRLQTYRPPLLSAD